MKPICRKVQETLAGDGVQALRADLAARRHLGECPECAAVLESLAALDQALETLPSLDAPDAAVSGLLARVEQEEQGRALGSIGGRDRLGWLAADVAHLRKRRRVFWGFAGAAAVVAFVGLTVPALYRARPAPSLLAAIEAEPAAVASRAGRQKELQAGKPSSSEDGALRDIPAAFPTEAYHPPLYEAPTISTIEELDRAMEEYERRLDASREHEPPPPPAAAPAPDSALFREGELADAGTVAGEGGPSPGGQRGPAARLRKDEEPLELAQAKADKKIAGADRDSQDAALLSSLERGGVEGGVLAYRLGDERMSAISPLRVGGKVGAPKKVVDVAPEYPDAARQASIDGVVILEITVDREGRVTDAKVLRGIPLLDGAALTAVKQWRYQPTLLNGLPVPVVMTVPVTFQLSEEEKEDERSGLPADAPTEQAQAFLAERTSIEGLAFEAPRGYWANTYLPGDPTLRLLQARLAAWDRSALEAAAGVPLRLHDDALQTAQPFDPPRHGALALYLHADRRGLEGPGRMLVQVGLQGSARAGARRPAMNVGLVLDLRGDLPVEVAAGMRALALAFSQAREAGDRFQLVVAGRPGGGAVGPGEFRHGPLTVTLGRLLEGGPAPDGESLDLVGAVAAAFEAVSRGDDPEAPLGSSTVVLVTGQPLGSSTPQLARLAHQGAVAGIPTTVVGVGPDVPLREMDHVALAGQGSRRRLESRSEALALVEQELATAARVVARAVRLRIRLAPGVRLVEVVGSRRLGGVQARRVREAERSIDLRLSRNLGIEADRGEDEDGIQIVIPSLRAGDAHAILLDVVAPGPGPVAEVTARYKDIVELRNGVARASFRLDAGARAEGPLERNVLKNLLASRLSETLTRAGDCLRAGDPVGAATLLEGARALRSGLGSLRPAFTGDPELGRDVAMLGEYVRLLRSAAATRPGDRARLADSLRYAGRLKVLPRPAPVAAPGA